MKKRMNVFVFLAAIMAGATMPAAEWFVSPDGTDAVGGGTEAAPFRTVNYAIGKASANDTITLLPGDHVEGSANNSRVNVTKPLTIRSKGRAYRDTTRIVGAYDSAATSPVGMGSNSLRCVRIGNDASGTRIEGVTFYRGATDFNNNAGAERSEGGGVMVCSRGVATIVDCAFVECLSTRGAGVFTDAVENESLKVVRCLFLRCLDTKFGAAMRGGAAYNCVFDDCGTARGANGAAVGEQSNAKAAFAYGYRAVNCTFVNIEGAGAFAAGNASFQGGIYNCLFQNNGSATSGTVAGTAANNTDNVAYNTTRLEVFSPYDGDYRLTVDASAKTTGSTDHLSFIPEEFRDTDYYGNPRATDGVVYAGAVQDALTEAVSGVGFSWTTSGSWTLGGEPVTLAYRTWRGTVGWPVPQKVGIDLADGRALVHFIIGDTPVWPLHNDTVWMHPHRIGIAQTASLTTTTTIYYTDPVEGDDETGDGTEAHPFATITKAIQTSSSTHVVRAKAGDYNSGSQNVNSFASRVAVQDTFKGILRVVAVDGPDVTFITGTEGTANDYKLGTDAVRCIGVACTNKFLAAFQGFTLRNGHTISGSMGPSTMGGGFCNINSSGGSSLGTGWLLDCRVENCTGQRGGAMAGGTAMRCTFSDCLAANGAGGGVFRHCSVVSSFVTGCGGASELFCGGATAYNVTTYGNTVSAFYDSTNGNGNLRNSVLTGRADGGVDLQNGYLTSTDATVQHCLYSKGGASSGVTLTTSVKEDPVRFLDVTTGNYRLSEASAGYGLASTTYLQSCMDINGDPFVFDLEAGTYQAGCYAPRPVAEVATLYVDATNGNDANDGSESAPFATLAAAMSVAQHGDTVIALPGTYETGTMVPNLAQAGGNAGNVTPTIAARVVVKSGVTLESRDGAAVTVIRGAEATGGGCGPDAVRCVFLCKDATLRGFTVTGGYTAATKLSNGTQDSTVDNYGGGVAGYAGTTATDEEFLGLVENCVISNNMALRGGGARFGTYRNCVFTGNTLCAGKPGYAVYSVLLEGCFFYDNGPSGSHSTIYDSQVVNCTVLSGQASGSGVILNEGSYAKKRSTVNSIVLSSKINVYAMTNCVLSASTVNKYDGDPATNNVIIGGTTLDANGVPLAGSTAIDAGDASLCSPELLAARDLAGVRRGLNRAVDIGAFEYDWGVPWGEAVCGPRLRFTDIPANATLEGGRTLVFTGADVPVEAAWAKGSGNAPFAFTAQVRGTGTLAVTANGNPLATLTAADGAMPLKFASSLAANGLVFSYDGDDEPGVALWDFSQNSSLVIIIR